MNTRWLYNNKTMVAAAVTAALVTGCGGGSDSSTDSGNPTPVTGFTVTALDGYLHKASVKVDNDNNGVCETDLGVTDEKGQLKVDGQYKDKPLCVTATPGTTVDMTRGVVESAFTLKAPAGAVVVNPLTNLVVEKLENDSTLDLAAAQKSVVDALVESGIPVDNDDAFGDYLSATNSPQDALKSKQLEVIGEVLVDNHDKANISPESKLTIVKQVATEVKDKTSADELEGFNPVVGDIKEDGSVDPITVNHRPKSIGAKDLTFKSEISVGGTTSINLASQYGLAFEDVDSGDSFTLKVSTDSEYQNGVSLSNEGVLFNIKHDKAGVYTFYIFAIDSHGARSNPVELKVTFTSPDLAPSVDEETKATFVETIKAIEFTKGVEFPEQTFSLDGLFIDEDVAALTINADTDAPGMSATISSGQLVIKGTPTVDGEFNLVVWAQDAVNQDQASVNIFYTIKPSDVAVTHPLENKVFYSIENSAVAEHPMLGCYSLKFENNVLYFSDISTDYTCSEPNLQVGTYSVEGDIIKTVVNDGTSDEVDHISIVKAYDFSQGYLIKATSQTSQTNGAATVWLGDIFTTSKHVESTLNMRASGTIYRSFLWHNNGYIDPATSVMLNGLNALNNQPFASVSFASALTCDDVMSIYPTFYLSNENRATAISTVCAVNSETNQPTVQFNSLSGTGEENLVNGKFYTISADLAPAFADKMAPLAARIEHQGVQSCTTGDDSRDSNDNPISLSSIEQYQAAITDCKAASNTVMNIESAVTTLLLNEPVKHFTLKNLNQSYVFYDQPNGQRSVNVKEGSQSVGIGTWDYVDGDIVISNAKDANNTPVNLKETIAMTSWRYDNLGIAVKSLLQEQSNDSLGLGDWTTHGSVSSDVYVIVVGAEH
ncbi:hypothetical protein [Vibrio sp. SCSIO 43136]|uniref:hypothetical protein n=1 Tax=Vibrio sp. SCSIO 43136 TaxID=2819101 RepID=UPI002075B35E|nr:hypothetical protein [Vibrio sp. SCSIO 43136]USD67305.1 hypothetical protein J4N39_21985 [Vibrio sp. SCSIO 43136]